MNAVRGLLLTVLALLLWAGCYSSPVPLGPPSAVPIDTTWVGEWAAVADSASEVSRLLLMAFNDNELLAEVSADTVVGGIAFDWKRARFRVFPTDVEGVLFANVQAIDFGESRDYFFYRVDVDADTMILRAIEADLFREGGWLSGSDIRFSDSAALKAYVAERLNHPDLLEDQGSVWVKVKRGEE